MQVKDVMSNNPTYLSPTATLTEASSEMFLHNWGFLPIGENDRLIGALTDRDITIRSSAKGLNPTKTQVRDVMTKEIFWCYEDDDIASATKYMSEKHVHRLAVLDKNKRLTGIISLSDIVTKTHDAKMCGQFVESLYQKTDKAH
jgi:CBS domain-containing protein